MWWKILSVFLLTGIILAGMLIPLNQGLTSVKPVSGKTGSTDTVEIHGYNSFFTRSADSLRVWLTYKGQFALQGRSIRVKNDTVLTAVFDFPRSLPKGETFTVLDGLIDDPTEGKAELARVFTLFRDTTLENKFDSTWLKSGATNLHKPSKFRFAYTPNNYESIRNFYFHVPMWMVLIVLMLLSVWHSVKYLRKPAIIHDVRAATYAQVGLLFGFLGLFTGMIWANYTWGKPWSNDIKQLMTAAALLIYVAYFILRSSFDESEKGARIAAVYNIFAFASLIPLLYILPNVFTSLHPGGEESPVFNRDNLNSNMRIFFWPANIGWSLLAVWIAQLRIRYKKLEAKVFDL